MGKNGPSIDHRQSAIDRFGLLNIAKPAGLTSRDVVDRIQRLVRPAKAGHAGTLDPLATGVLIVCVGKATRLVPRIQEFRKTYRATFLLGRTSQTDDIEGTIVETPGASRPTLGAVLAALPEFVGRIAQRPPAHSAVRVGGRRAYKLARLGNEVQVDPRPVDVHRIDLLAYTFPELVLEIECGTGTYIRSIGRDLGERLGCGAVLSALERTAIGPFKIESGVPLTDVNRESLPELLLPPTAAVPELSQLVVNTTDAAALANGRSVSVAGVIARTSPAAETAAGLEGRSVVDCLARSGDRPPQDVVGGRGSCRAAGGETAVLDESGRLIAFAVINGDRLAPKMVFASQE